MNLSKVGLYVAVLVMSLLLLFPIYVLFLIAFTPVKFTIGSVFPTLYPGGFTIANLINAFKGNNFVAPFFRSLETAFLVGGLAIVMGIPAAYSLSKLPRNVSNLISSSLFLINMLPALVIAIPISAQFISYRLYDTIPGLALAQELIVLPLTIFLLLGAFQSLPPDLENQARVDGAGMVRTIFTVLVPLAKAAIAAAFLLAWMVSWDEFTFAIILSSPTPTLPIVIYNIMSGRASYLTGSAFSLAVTLPVIIMTVILQKYLRGEYLSGGMHG
jgi:trehalose transport system permease protein